MRPWRRNSAQTIVTTALLSAMLAVAFAASIAAAPKRADAEGTSRNADSNLTVMDESSDPSDVALTREIRRRLADLGTLSTSARNVEVVTIARVVTLRGAVEDEGERMAVAAVAQGVAGVRSVDNQLEVEAR